MTTVSAATDPLRDLARTAAERAYAPYSKFRVGAAILARSGAIFAGCNVENASYGLTICAERNAVFQMVAAGEREFDRIVIYTPTATPTAPCGACRQVLNEFNLDAEVVSCCDGPDVIRATVRELLPRAFGPANLG
jgi:cytidine deaminase